MDRTDLFIVLPSRARDANTRGKEMSSCENRVLIYGGDARQSDAAE